MVNLGIYNCCVCCALLLLLGHMFVWVLLCILMLFVHVSVELWLMYCENVSGKQCALGCCLSVIIRKEDLRKGYS